MPESTALAVREQTTNNSLAAYTPANYAEAVRIAEDLAKSRLTKVRTKEQAVAVMAAGAELGIPPMASLRFFYVADFGDGDQITMSADGMRAVCLARTAVCRYFRTVESTDEHVTVETWRVGDPDPVRRTFSLADAKRAKLGEVKQGKDATATNWAKYPQVMMRHRADAILAREVYPDILGGYYTPDEAREIADARDVTPPDVRPLTPASKPAPPEIADAEIVESNEARADRIVRALDAATTEADRAEIMRRENEQAPLDKMPRGAARDRILAANKAARERVGANGATPAGTAAVLAAAETREPGSDG